MLRNRPPQSLITLALSLAAVAMYTAGEYATGWLGAFLFPACCITAAVAGVELFEWLSDIFSGVYERTSRARSITPAGELASRIATMPAERLQVYQVAMEIGEFKLSGGAGYTVISGIPIPENYIDSHLRSAVNRNDARYLPAQHGTSGNSVERKYRQAINNKLLAMGGAEVRRQNEPPVLTVNTEKAWEMLKWDASHG